MKNINEDISKNEYKKIYLLYGEETYLRKMYKEKLCKAMLPEGDTMNCNYYEGSKINIQEVIDMSETLPFFADKRIILIEDSGFFKNKTEELADYLKEASDSTYFIFVENEVDKRNRMYKVAKDRGRVVDFALQDEATLTKWILGRLKKENKNITQSTMRLLLSKTGVQMDNIEREVEKLLSYTLEKNIITEQDVEDICTTRTTNKIFDMINAIAQKNQKRALGLYYDLLALKEPPMRILFLIARQFNYLMQTKDLMTQGFDKSTIGKKLGFHGFIAGNYISQARQFSMEKLKEAVLDCVLAEEHVKTGRINDRLSVELLIVKYSE
jgi:DNA polymerase III, delta subunit